MNDLNQMSTPVLQDWWERYVCPACMSKRRESGGLCPHAWHSVPAVTFECEASAFSPLSIPVSELQQVGQLRSSTVVRYGKVWTRTRARVGRPTALGFV